MALQGRSDIYIRRVITCQLQSPSTYFTSCLPNSISHLPFGPLAPRDAVEETFGPGLSRVCFSFPPGRGFAREKGERGPPALSELEKSRQIRPTARTGVQSNSSFVTPCVTWAPEPKLSNLPTTRFQRAVTRPFFPPFPFPFLPPCFFFLPFISRPDYF